MLNKNFLGLVLACGLSASVTALAEAETYNCGLASGPSEPAKYEYNGGSLRMVAGEYLGYVKEDAETSELILGIFHKADENAQEQPIAAGISDLGAKKLYVVAFHEGNEVQAICDKK